MEKLHVVDTADLMTDSKAEKNLDGKSKEHNQKQQGAAGNNQVRSAQIGITARKEVNFSAWYIEVIQKAELLEYGDIPGFFIMAPASTAVWDSIHDFLDERIKKMKVRNCLFPLVIAEKRLATEKEHLDGFSAEVAWITHGGDNALQERIALRPTSETAMYPYFAKKIRSHRDLPLKLNQWVNVVRWEMKHAIPFLRSREFYWQEGHTAHLTEELADQEVLQVLDHYAAVYEELLAVPVVKGTKTDNEKFSGAHYTTTIEAFIPEVGRGVQAGTSHCLGQHFSKMFRIKVQDPASTDGDRRDPIHVWQNSWGLSTRSIGVMIMVHSDNKGLVLPPRVAEIQVIIIPVGVTAKSAEEERVSLYRQIDDMETLLQAAGVRVETDKRESYAVGFKFNDWELKGIPLRVEFGPKDRAKHQVMVSRRDTGEKSTIALSRLGEEVRTLLNTIQADMFKRAEEVYRARRVVVESWDDFISELDGKKACFIRHCLGGECEDEIKKLSARVAVIGEAEDARAPSMGAKSLCIPFDQPSQVTGNEKCVNPNCLEKAKKWVMFGRSY